MLKGEREGCSRGRQVCICRGTSRVNAGKQWHKQNSPEEQKEESVGLGTRDYNTRCQLTSFLVVSASVPLIHCCGALLKSARMA